MKETRLSLHRALTWVLISGLCIFCNAARAWSDAGRINETIDQFLIARIVPDEELFLSTLDPAGELEATIMGEVHSLNADEFKRQLFYRATESVLESRDITIDGDTAVVSGTWRDGRVSRDQIEGHILECTFRLTRHDEAWYVSALDIETMEEFSAEAPVFPGTLRLKDTDYFTIQYPPSWTAEAHHSEPTQFIKDIFHASFGISRFRQPGNFAIRIAVQKRDFDDFPEKMEQRLTEMKERGRASEILEVKDFTIAGQPARSVFRRYEDFSGQPVTEMVCYVANDDYVARVVKWLDTDAIERGKARFEALTETLRLKQADKQ